MVWLGSRSRRLERKVAGLLAYLALEGATPRSTLAGLLWPDSEESNARSNLRQVLHRLRGVLGTEVVRGDEALELHPQVEADVARLELAAFAGQAEEVLAYEGELLAGHDYDDCPEFLEWLLAQRERLNNQRRDALLRLSEQAEAQGNVRAAIHHAERLLELDPVSEVVYRQLMRLHHLAGDRGAALRAFRQCCTVLKRELGVTPMPETLELAAQIEAQQQVRLPGPGPRRELPLSVQRPPVLVGRETEWARLETAWTKGQIIFVSGPPGVGKSRLLREFLDSKGEVLCFDSRPGDHAVPFMSVARAHRQLLAQFADVPLEAWVRAELARVLPELGPSPEGLHSEADKLRFYEAQAQFVASALRDRPHIIMMDDFQFTDDFSREAWTYLLTQPAFAALHIGLTFRQDELGATDLDTLRAMVEGGQAMLIELQPLTGQAVGTLLETVLHHAALPAPATGLSQALTRHTGGNPLFILETLRSLIESDELAQAGSGKLPLPRRLEPLVSRRLERVSAQAQRAARTAAVAGADFDLELLAAVLECHPLDLAGPWAELEAAQIMRGSGFAHDLMAQAARAGVPAPVRVLLHRRIAAYLEKVEAQTGQPEAARLAEHWEAAGDGGRAARWWLKAAQVSRARGAFIEAAGAFERVLQAPELPLEQGLEARYGLGEMLMGIDPALAAEHLDHLLLEARAQRQSTWEGRAHLLLAELGRVRGQLAEGLEHIAQALALLSDEVSPDTRAEAWRMKFWLELRSGHLLLAEEAIGEAIRLTPLDPELENERALLYWHAGRFRQAASMFEALLERLRAQGPSGADPLVSAYASNMSWTYWALARNDEATALLQMALAGSTIPFDRGIALLNLATVQTSQGHYREALVGLAEAETCMAAFLPHLSDILHRQGVLAYRAERHAEAQPLLARAVALAREVGDPYRLSYILATLAANTALLGDHALALEQGAEADALARHIQFPLSMTIAAQGYSVALRLAGQASQALERAEAAAELARSCGLPEQLGYGLWLCGLIPGPHAEAALTEALHLGQQYRLPDLIWRAAAAAGQAQVAQAALERLSQAAPPGWFKPDLLVTLQSRHPV